MQPPVAPPEQALEAQPAPVISIPTLIDASFRIPWKVHGPFSFGDSWPKESIEPLLRFLATPVQRPTPWSLIWKTWEREKQVRRAWEREVNFHIIQLNSTPELEFWRAARSYVEVLKPQVTFVNLDLNQVGFKTARPHDPQVGNLETAERWEHYALADVLIRIMLPHATLAEQAQPDRTWATLCRRYKAYEQLLPRVSPAECQRRKNTFLLAVYERSLATRVKLEKPSSSLLNLFSSFTKYAALRLHIYHE